MLTAFRKELEGVVFSGVFSDNTVLQREPYHSALFGASDTPHTAISLTVSGQQLEGRSYSDSVQSMTDSNGDWKVVLRDAMPNGGNYSVTVQCPRCGGNGSDSLHNVTFGDVYYCSGQSNMELAMHFTFSRNTSYQSISDGRYRNIRYITMKRVEPSNVSYVLPPMKSAVNQWQPVRSEIVDVSLDYGLDKFSAPCWYFAESLVDLYGVKDVVIGLIDTAVGGSKIEQWIQNQTVERVCDSTNCPAAGCGGLYNGLVASYLNMTVRAFLWYQGENNVFEEPGSWYNNTGYGCMEPFMLRQWRSQWSVTPGTTSPVTPFGLVTLAGGTSEGHGQNMGRFRWTQMGSFDYLPNHELVNTFAAQAYDLGDPWNKECFYLKPPRCQGDSVYSWNKTNFYMGPIHPRPKLIVGRRLAISGYPLLYGPQSVELDPTAIAPMENEANIGPVLSGCKVMDDGNELVIEFNKTLSILPDANYPNGVQSDGKVHVVPFVAWYNASINWTNTDHWTAMEVEIKKQWYFVENIKEGTDGISVVADISSFVGETITGVRYAWSDYPCCGTLNRNYNPCPPDSCPIKTGTGNMTLPAVPFWSKIVNMSCECFAPQTCDSMSN